MTGSLLQSGRRLHDVLDAWATERGATEAAICGDRRLTYAELRVAVNDTASALIAADVMPGDRVATLAPPGIDFLVTFLAAASVGAIWVGLNPRYTDPELDAVVEQIAPRVIFSRRRIGNRAYDGWLAGLPGEIRIIGLDGDHAAFVEPSSGMRSTRLRRRRSEVRADDICLIVFTSGSTGSPKGVMISHASLVGASEVQFGVWPAEPLRILNNLPINHIGCVGDLTCYALVAGGTIVFAERFDPQDTLRLIRSEAITVWGQVPTQFQLVLDSPTFDAGALGSLQRIFWGGALASEGLVERLLCLCAQVATSYGQTETVGSIAFTASDAGRDELVATVGRPVPPYSLRIVEAEGADSPAGNPGEVIVKTPFGMSGYWGEGLGAAPEWHRTGDVGSLDHEGRLRLVGRVHDIFKSGGYNINPAEIEAALEAHPRIREASVVGVPDERYGTVAVAFLVPVESAFDTSELSAFLVGRIANYKHPKRYHQVEELPRLPVGKIDKAALRARAARA